MPADVRPIITAHAMQRWLERCARYGDERVGDIEAAFARSRRVQAGEPLAIFRQAGMTYYEADGILFVCEPENRGRVRVVTVLDPASINHNPLLPKRKRRREPEPEVPADPDDREALLREHKRLQGLLADGGKKFARGEKTRLKVAYAAVCKALARLRQREQQQRHERYAGDRERFRREQEHWGRGAGD